MNTLPGSTVDVGFGDAEARLPNWRKDLGDADPDDVEMPVTPADVVAVLGFDPLNVDEDGNDLVNNEGTSEGAEKGWETRKSGGAQDEKKVLRVIGPPPVHLIKTFESGSKPLRAKLSYGDPVMFLDGTSLVTGEVWGIGDAQGIEIKTKAGEVVKVPRAQARHFKSFRGPKENEDEAAQLARQLELIQ